MLLIDAHQDIAWNMLTFGRDYLLPVDETRRLERGTIAPKLKEDTIAAWPEFQKGQVAVVFSTLFACPERRKMGEWEILSYADTNTANRLYRQQMDLYHRLVDDHPDEFRLVQDRRDLAAVLKAWENMPGAKDVLRPPGYAGETAEQKNERREDEMSRAQESEPQKGLPVGLVLLMEGAEGVRAPGELEEWWAGGVRIIGPAWAGTRFCGGTREPGALTQEGVALLEAMGSLGFVLDLAHMDEAAVLGALDIYPGPIIASHANALALLKGSESNRHLSDRVLRSLLERDGVVGILPANPFLKAGWQSGDRREEVGLERATAQIDYICQLAGDARHAGIGSDFNGGIGLQSMPYDVDTIADLQKIGTNLVDRGYSVQDVAAIFHGNWERILHQVLPESV